MALRMHRRLLPRTMGGLLLLVLAVLGPAVVVQTGVYLHWFEEQRRIGQDLHAGLGQNLAGIIYVVDSLEQKLSRKALPEAQDAAKAIQLLDQAMAQARSLASGGQPAPDPQSEIGNRQCPETQGKREGIGLHIMRYRASLLGGTLDIRRVPEGGTLVTCCLPAPRPQEKPG